MPAAPPTVELSAAACAEIADVARRTGRSVAFIARRALAAGADAATQKNAVDAALQKNAADAAAQKNAADVAAQKNAADVALQKNSRAKLALTTSEDDGAGLHAKLRAAAGKTPLGEAIERAWTASREKFFAWAAREESAGAAEQADELDAGLRDAQSPSTSAARLAELAASAYPRVRLLAASHPSLPPGALAKLADDRERVVREAAAQAALRRSTK